MKFIPLHTTNTAIVYKNSLCSLASLIVLAFIALSVMVPVLLVSLLSPYSGIAESRVLYEQPDVAFKYQNIFVATVAETDVSFEGAKTGLIACSSFAQFNERMQQHSDGCADVQYWTQDLDYDGHIDRAHFQLELDTEPMQRLQSIELVLFFEATLKHKCALSPPALLAHQLLLPSTFQLNTGTILLKAELELKQYVEFVCPFPGRNVKTHFRNVHLNTNNTTDDGDDIGQYRMESLLRQLKSNPAYFQLAVQETYVRQDRSAGLRVQLDLDVLQVPARYHLSVWERSGQFWLYFASFFGISFYVMNKLKDYLFGQHIIRSWEVIPWKKLY